MASPFKPVSLPKTQGPLRDCDEFIRRLQSHLRRMRKRQARAGSDLAEFDHLLSALKQMRKHCNQLGVLQDPTHVFEAFLAFIGDEDPR